MTAAPISSASPQQPDDRTGPKPALAERERRRQAQLEQIIREQAAELAWANEQLQSHIDAGRWIEQTLIAERDFIAAIVDTVDALIIVLDRAGRTIRFNRTCQETTGYTFDEVRDQPFWSLFLLPAEVEPVRAVLAELRADRISNRHEAYWLTRDGRKRLIAWSNTALLDDNGELEYIICTGIDITERRRAEETLQKAYAEQEQILAVQQAVTSRLEIEAVLEMIATAARRLTGARVSLLYLIEAGRLRLAVVSGAENGDMPANYTVPLTESTAGLSLQAGRPLLVNEASTDPRVNADLRRRLHLHRLVAVPLISGQQPLGVLEVADKPEPFGPDDTQILAMLTPGAVIALENARLYAQAQRAAALEERQRLARELHDAVTQTLFSASLIADVLPEMWDQDPAHGRRLLQDLQQLSRGALAEMRTLLLELRPAALREAKLGDLIHQLAAAFTGREGTLVTVNLNRQDTFPDDMQVSLYRITQEALHNIAKHAGASRVTIHLWRTPAGSDPLKRVTLKIIDNGCGFDPAGVPPDHLGLGIMRERAEAIGATLDIISWPDQGTQIEVNWKVTVR
ncbi:MAG: PAS domain S-box protein [Anaerolineae bacterium]|nr:PAS domain S-box protein [Anaerolineae bacterium]MCB9104651.1 PAS domain S-box protein [Anaerolineales bacterium]